MLLKLASLLNTLNLISLAGFLLSIVPFCNINSVVAATSATMSANSEKSKLKEPVDNVIPVPPENKPLISESDKPSIVAITGSVPEIVTPKLVPKFKSSTSVAVPPLSWTCIEADALTIEFASIVTPERIRSVPSNHTYFESLPKIIFPAVKSKNAPASPEVGAELASGMFPPFRVPAVMSPMFADTAARLLTDTSSAKTFWAFNKVATIEFALTLSAVIELAAIVLAVTELAARLLAVIELAANNSVVIEFDTILLALTEFAAISVVLTEFAAIISAVTPFAAISLVLILLAFNKVATIEFALTLSAVIELAAIVLAVTELADNSSTVIAFAAILLLVIALAAIVSAVTAPTVNSRVVIELDAIVSALTELVAKESEVIELAAIEFVVI